METGDRENGGTEILQEGERVGLGKKIWDSKNIIEQEPIDLVQFRKLFSPISIFSLKNLKISVQFRF